VAFLLGLALAAALPRAAAVEAGFQITPTPSFVPLRPGPALPFPTPQPPPTPTTLEAVSMVGLGVVVGLIVGGPLGIVLGLIVGRFWR
jgi:hypothetical protein